MELRHKRLNIKAILIIDAFLFLICILGVYQFSHKPELPFKIISFEGDLIFTDIPESNTKIEDGDVLHSINESILNSTEEIEIYLDSKTIGDKVTVNYIKNNILFSEKIELINYYSIVYDIIAAIVGAIFFIIGIFVLIKCSNDLVGHVFHWATIATALIILTTWGSYSNFIFPLNLFPRFGFHLGYSFCIVFFLHFTLLFP